MSELHAVYHEWPLYKQVHKRLRERIAAGEWGPHDPLPGEVALSHELGVSVGTIRRAMEQLIRESMVVRERGRGTFVRNGGEWRPDAAFRLEPRGVRSGPCAISVVSSEVALATDCERKVLQLGPRSSLFPSVIRLYRRWLDDHGPVCSESIVVEAARFPDLRDVVEPDLETLFPLYASVYRLSVDRVRWAISSGDACGGLGSAGTLDGDAEPLEGPTLTIERTAIDARGVPVELCRQHVLLAACTLQIDR